MPHRCLLASGAYTVDIGGYERVSNGSRTIVEERTVLLGILPASKNGSQILISDKRPEKVQSHTIASKSVCI